MRRKSHHPGYFRERNPDLSYTALPTHEGGPGCKIIPNEVFIDGSACGVGKSEAAWNSLKDHRSVVVISYGKTFTEKVESDRGIESYVDIAGDIIFKPDDRRRVVIQWESLHRIKGVPDVLIVDEWHGIRRQQFSSVKHSRERWDNFAGLVTVCKRLIVLDADADEDDLILFRDKLGRSSMKFIISDVKPDRGKKFSVESSHKSNLLNLLEQLNRNKTTGNKIEVFTYNKHRTDYSVENLAKQLQHLGYRVRYYHADTDPAQKKLDFSSNTAFDDVDVVITNHTLEAGVSIVDERFNVMYVFSEELGSVEATKQAIHRFRCVNEIHYSATRKQHDYKLPVTREDVEKIIIDRERLLDDKTKLSRCPNAGELSTAYGFAYLNDIIAENNSKMYFTPRLITMMKNTGYEIIETPVDDYETWKRKNKY